MIASTTNMSWTNWHNKLHKELQAKPNLLPSGANLLIAVSGGQDSMALLKLIIDLRTIYNWNLQVWHGDHGWHKNSKEIAKELKEWCELQNLKFHIAHTTKETTKTEAEARRWRYQELANSALRLASENAINPCNHVLTGHTGSDRAETLILNLARGTGLSGLSSLKDKRLFNEKLQLVRPMLSFSRNETKQICMDFHLPIWVDPSNENLNLKRNKIRQKILPVLEEMHPGCSLRMASLSERLEKYNIDQQELASLALNSLKKQEGLCRKELAKLSSTARATILVRWLKQSGAPSLSTSQLKTISQRISRGKPPGSFNIAKGWVISWVKESIQLHYLRQEN